MNDRPSLSTVSISTNLFEGKGLPDFEIDEPQPTAAFDRYELGELLGKGGMGLVYRAYDKEFDRVVAIKVLLKSFQDREPSRDRFFQEARTTARLQHPGIVSVYDMGLSNDGQPFFAMKLVEGRTLSDLLRDPEHSPIQQSRLLEIFSRVCQTIAFAHSHQTVHLDIKPSNVMVGAFGEVHVMDWGLSRRLDRQTVQLTPISPSVVDAISDEVLSTMLSNSKIIGTPSYMAPEQARGREVSVRSDVFGLGSLLCEILTGAPPYDGDSFVKVFRRAARGSLKNTYLRLDTCDADPALIALSKRCLARNADERPANAGMIAHEITSFVESAMERAHRDLARFFEISDDLYCTASLDGFFKRVNSNFATVLGYCERELVSKPFADFIHPDDLSQTEEVVRLLASGLPIASFRNRYRDANGDYRWLEWRAKSIPQDNIIFAVARIVSADSAEPASGDTAHVVSSETFGSTATEERVLD